MGSGLLQMGTRPRLDGRGPHLRSHASGWEQPVGKLLEGLSGLLQPDTGFIRSVSRMGSGLPQNWVCSGLILFRVLGGLWPPPELGGRWPHPIACFKWALASPNVGWALASPRTAWALASPRTGWALASSHDRTSYVPERRGACREIKSSYA